MLQAGPWRSSRWIQLRMWASGYLIRESWTRFQVGIIQDGQSDGCQVRGMQTCHGTVWLPAWNFLITFLVWHTIRFAFFPPSFKLKIILSRNAYLGSRKPRKFWTRVSVFLPIWQPLLILVSTGLRWHGWECRYCLDLAHRHGLLSLPNSKPQSQQENWRRLTVFSIESLYTLHLHASVMKGS